MIPQTTITQHKLDAATALKQQLIRQAKANSQPALAARLAKAKT